ncbi:MAG: hypothetical protein BMS9Abin23_0176 [Thermodesulfobacteriota bacterium]|nr:MAG: hypothetical protein BMS9Abin23_0176 [Thermodesulfobacteriota bacterium]
MTGMIIKIIILAVGAAVIPALIAWHMGRNPLKWWVYGFVLFPVALIHSIVILTSEGRKTCGYCRRKVKMSAAHCPKCGYEFLDFN